MISIKVKDPLFTYHARLVNILDFNPEKVSIEKVCAINDELEHIYYVKYNNNSFHLVIDNLKGYFKYSKEKDEKKIKIYYRRSNEKKNYNQLWDKIRELFNNVDGVNFGISDYFRDHGVTRFDTDDTLPLDTMVNIYSMAIIIRSVYSNYYDRFYPEIHLANCIYVQSN